LPARLCMGLGLLVAKEVGRELGREVLRLAGHLLLRPSLEREVAVGCPVVVPFNRSTVEEECARIPRSCEIEWSVKAVVFLPLLVSFLLGTLAGGRWCPQNGRPRHRRRGGGVIVRED
jgi:hypothetical protein